MKEHHVKLIAIGLMVTGIVLSFLKGMPLSLEYRGYMDPSQSYGIIHFLGLDIHTTVEVVDFISYNLYTIGEIGVALFFIGMASGQLIAFKEVRRSLFIPSGLIIIGASVVVISELAFKFLIDPFSEGVDAINLANWVGFFGCAVGTMLSLIVLSRGERRIWWPTIPAVSLIALYLIILALFYLFSYEPISTLYHLLFWVGQMALFVGLAAGWGGLRGKWFIRERTVGTLFILVVIGFTAWCVLTLPAVLLDTPPWALDNFETISTGIFLEMMVTCAAFSLGLFTIVKRNGGHLGAQNVEGLGTAEGKAE